MSLILEALRRSEAERQRGRVPGLFVEQQALPPRRRRRWPAWAWLPALLLPVLAIGWGWREWRAMRDGDRAVAPAVSAPAAPAVPGASAARPGIPGATPAPPAALPLPTDPTPMVTAPAPAPAAPAAAPAPATAPPGPAPRPAPPPVAAAEPAPAVSAPVDAPGTAPTRLADLAPAERASLPPLQLSMHVYSDAPGRRFVIVDGRRLGEGATAGPGLVVESIRRDGVVLDHDGRRLLLPRP